MIRTTASLVLTACLSFSVWADTPDSVLNTLQVPTGADVQIVTSHSLHNGMPMAIAQLRSTESADSVFGFYRQLWTDPQGDGKGDGKGDGGSDGSPGFVESVLPEWQMISRVHNGYNIVIQLMVESGQSASGFISVMAIDAPLAARDHGEFSDLQLLSKHQSVDGADTSLMRVYASSSSVSQTHRIYLEKLMSKGWQLLSDNELDGSYVMVLSRGQSRLEVSIVPSRDYGSLVVVHKVTSK